MNTRLITKDIVGKKELFCEKEECESTSIPFKLTGKLARGILDLIFSGYGQVFLARKDHKVYAIKKMSKVVLHNLGETRHILNERDILAGANSIWLVKLIYAFQDPESVFLAMEFVPGGDFRTLLTASGVLREQHAQFYFSEMCASVFALHELGFIHRDLKPENFLLDATGHLKLTDFGLSRGSMSQQVIDVLKKKFDELKDVPLTFKSNNIRTGTQKGTRKNLRAFSLVGSPDYSI